MYTSHKLTRTIYCTLLSIMTNHYRAVKLSSLFPPEHIFWLHNAVKRKIINGQYLRFSRILGLLKLLSYVTTGALLFMLMTMQQIVFNKNGSIG